MYYAEPPGLTSWGLTPVLAATTFHLLLVHLPLLDQTSKTSTLPVSPTPRLEELGPTSLKTEEDEFQQNALRVQRPNGGENDFKPCEFRNHWAPRVGRLWKPRMLLKPYSGIHLIFYQTFIFHTCCLHQGMERTPGGKKCCL